MTTVPMELKGDETMVMAACPMCWAKGARAVLYLAPGDPLPNPMHCPICGVQRRLPAPPTSPSKG
jgi:hypothetical protein